MTTEEQNNEQKTKFSFKSIAIGIGVGLAVVAFAFSGMGSNMGGGSNSAATIGEFNISLRNLGQYAEYRLNYMKPPLPENASEAEKKAYEEKMRELEKQILSSTLDELVQEKLLQYDAQEIFGKPSQPLRTYLVATNPEFFDETGKFSNKKYNQLIVKERKENALIESLNTRISQAQLMSFIKLTPPVPLHVAEIEREMALSEYTLQYAEIKPSQEIMDKFISQYLEKNESTLKEKYEKNIHLYVKPKTYTFNTILISFTGAENSKATRSQEEALNLAQSIMKQAQAEKKLQTFIEQTEDPDFNIDGGLWSDKKSDDLEDSLAQELLKLQMNDISSPILTKQGYRLIQLTHLSEAKNVSFDDFKKQEATSFVLSSGDVAGEIKKLKEEYQKLSSQEERQKWVAQQSWNWTQPKEPFSKLQNIQKQTDPLLQNSEELMPFIASLKLPEDLSPLYSSLGKNVIFKLVEKKINLTSEETQKEVISIPQLSQYLSQNTSREFSQAYTKEISNKYNKIVKKNKTFLQP